MADSENTQAAKGCAATFTSESEASPQALKLAQASLGPETQSQVTSKTLAYPAQQIKPPREPQFPEFYQPSKPQKPGDLLLWAAARSLFAFASFRFL